MSLIIDPAASVLSGALLSTKIADEEIDFLSTEHPVGLTIFSRNLEAEQPTSLRALTDQIQSCNHPDMPPMIISIDQEGGRVTRLKAPFPNEGPAMALAGGKSDQAAVDFLADYGKRVGHELLNLGVNCNFAPVVDVLTVPTNDSIGDRAFARDAGGVVIRAGAFLVGLNATGVISCLKHFPGQGGADIDTHVGTARVDLSRSALEKCEMYPFKSLIKNCPMVMVSHCIFSDLDDVEASLSSKVITDILRKDLGFSGIVVSDDMTMGAIAEDEDSWVQSIIRTILAGSDLVLVCKDLKKWKLALQAVRSEAASSHIFSKRLSDASDRVYQLRKSLSR